MGGCVDGWVGVAQCHVWTVDSRDDKHTTSSSPRCGWSEGKGRGKGNVGGKLGWRKGNVSCSEGESGGKRGMRGNIRCG